MFLGKTLQLLIVAIHQGGIYRCCLGGSIFFYPYRKFYLATHQLFSNNLSHLHFLLTIERCNTGCQVKLLRIQRLHFNVDFLSFVSHDSLAVARH